MPINFLKTFKTRSLIIDDVRLFASPETAHFFQFSYCCNHWTLLNFYDDERLAFKNKNRRGHFFRRRSGVCWIATLLFTCESCCVNNNLVHCCPVRVTRAQIIKRS